MKRRNRKIMNTLFIVAVILLAIKPSYAAADPGSVVISGQVTYQPRNWNPQQLNWQPGREMKVELFEKDLQGYLHYLDTTYSDGTGNFVFPSRKNWWSPDNQQLNISLRVATVYQNTSVTDRWSAQYAFESDSTFLSYDGSWVKNFTITNGWTDYQAVWIFEDLRNAWNFVHSHDFRNGVPYDPGNVTAMWETSLNCYPWLIPGFPFICDSSFAYGGPGSFIFIANTSTNSMDVVAHETGHMYMVNANHWWYVSSNCFSHYMFSSIDSGCAWSEGWADFLPLAVNGNSCYNFGPNPCQGNYYDLEAHNRGDQLSQYDWGETVEGRVAGALYDLYDSNNEGFDGRSAGFGPISSIALGSSQITTFDNFWNHWLGSSQDLFLSGLTLWWNTIEYIDIQQNFLPMIAK
jgi:hypothetical protein